MVLRILFGILRRLLCAFRVVVCGRRVRLGILRICFFRRVRRSFLRRIRLSCLRRVHRLGVRQIRRFFRRLCGRRVCRVCLLGRLCLSSRRRFRSRSYIYLYLFSLFLANFVANLSCFFH